ncbi:MAG: HU family DNA-binding protein [Bdellovibrionales bacterium]|nr:HU family DNA-binding protein [Bdellovibrionales bacterium]
MTKMELVERVFKDNKFRKIPRTAIEEILNGTFDLFVKSIQKDGKFTYPGFGSFVLKKRKARTGRNPQTGETLFIPSKKTVTFKAAPQLKETL